MAKERYTMSQVLAAIRRARGLVTFAAEILGCSDDTIYNYARRYPKVQHALDTARTRFVDVAEAKLYEAVMAREPWAVALVVKTLGKSRGYTERLEVHDVTQLVAAELARRGLTPAQAVAADPLMADLFSAVGMPVEVAE